MVAEGLKLESRRLGEQPSPLTGKGRDGTLLVVVCGLHGNEPAGVLAARRVLRDLAIMDVEMTGRVVALAGNMRALEERKRYIGRDLNRIFTPEDIDAARSGEADDPESLELRELAAEIEGLLEEDAERIVLLDLHSTSADGSPFAIMADSLQNRRVGAGMGIPVLLGLEERLDGTLLSYFSQRGHPSFCIEGGQNHLQSTVDNHESAIWLALVSTGILREQDVRDLASHRERLAETSWGLPEYIEVHHRQDVMDSFTYRMEPGYTNFHQVRRGEVLGHVISEGAEKAIRTPLDGLLLMPRYQGQGKDAFFVGRRVRPRWLRLSTWLRRLRLHWTLPLLPAVARIPGEALKLDVDGRQLRPWVMSILHLFGFRKRSREEHQLLFIRRRDEGF